MYVYRVMSYEEKLAKGIDTNYSVLLGPDGFECILTEPEDRSWVRDGSGAVSELNKQHEEIEKLQKRIKDFEVTSHPENFSDGI